MSIRFFLILVLTSLYGFRSTARVDAAESPDAVNFNRDIRSILSNTCYQCHGPDENKRQADMRLDSEEGIRHAFEPGELEGSEAWMCINSRDEKQRMPPPSAYRQLKPEEIERIGRWIEQGAEWQGHWAFVSPRRPSVPTVKRRDWVRNPIDAFILARLEKEGLTPLTQADRKCLIRRITFDLTGLPPTIEEIEDFLNDRSVDAYEKVVDRLIDSPHYGERMALAWMDAARYGDTSVFHADGPRDMWPWRGWSIRAYNSNKRFDQFAIEQLAGDLLPNATIDQKIATGFNRNNATTDEGGVIAEEFRVEYAVDRVKTTAMIWMGLSLECTQCHDHKYDPISQRKYYLYFAYFNQASDPGMQTRSGNQKPLADVPNYASLPLVETKKRQIEKLQQQLAQRRNDLAGDFEGWLAKQEAERAATPADMLLHLTLDESTGDAVESGRQGQVHGNDFWVDGRIGGAFQFDRKNFIDVGAVGNFERTDTFSYGAWVKTSGNAAGAVIARMDDDGGFRGYDLYLTGGRATVHIISRWDKNAIKVVSEATLEPDRWQHLFVTYDGSSKAAGITIYFDGVQQEWTIEQDRLSETIRTTKTLKLGRRTPGAPFAGHVDDVRVYARCLTGDEVAALAGVDPLDAILALARDQRKPDQVETLRHHYLQNHDQPYRETSERIARLKSELTQVSKAVGTVMVMQDVSKPRMTYILNRGNYDSPRRNQPVDPGTPDVLPPLPKNAPANRLGMARWLMQPNHLLTARVTMNRYWSMLFGTGIVKTVEDFGSQGEWPSHLDLLDWLAVDFVESGWNIKRMLKQIVMSADPEARFHRYLPIVFVAGICD